ncbi:hypothetical protein SMMN14_09369, partial [Sphaerulina musiva]
NTTIYSILRTPKFSYFKGALGTLDSIYINAVIPEERQSACNFLYTLVSYEGSANDRTVVNRAFRVRGLRILEGRYYLVDSSYSPKDNRLLVLY